MGPTQLRVVLLDSRNERRNLMIAVVEGDADRAVVVGEADCLTAAVLAVEDQRAHAVVVDLGMPTDEGLRAVHHLRRTFPALGIVVCSFDLNEGTIGQALAEGADRCLHKPVSPRELVDALEAARRPAPTPTEAHAV
jgi:DNA-binding NarL/FixJ family response regulator